jgi:maltose alpha-D-glucosyltransferase/alpha-amylase
MRSFDGMVSKEGGYQRTSVRTPMQWSNALNAGFSTAKPEDLYLPVDPSLDRPTVQQQETDPNSLLQRVRRLVAIRNTHPGLQASADFDVLYARPGKYPFVYQRTDGNEVYIIAINPSAQPAEAEFPSQSSAGAEIIYGQMGSIINKNGHYQINLPGISGAIVRVTGS